MPNPVLAETIKKVGPKFNDTTVGNLSSIWLKSFLPFLDNVIRSAARATPENFDYLGYRVRSPEEEYHGLLNSSIPYETARSDIIEAVLSFSYNGDTIERPIYIPFTTRFGRMHNTGTNYVITPVLTDSVISPDSSKVFVRLLRDKLNFESVIYNIHINGKVQLATIVYAETMLRSKKAINNLGKKAVTPIGLYPFARYGIDETYRRYFGIEGIVITNKEEEKDKLRKTHTIHEGLKRKPRWLTTPKYEVNMYAICIPNKYGHEHLHVTSALIYAFDMIPDLIPNIMGSYATQDINNERLYFTALLGRIAYRDGFSLTRSIEGVEEHFDALAGYLDTLIQRRLDELGVKVEDFIDFVVYLVTSFSEWLLKGKTFSNNIYNRYFDVLYYIAYDIIVGVNTSINTIMKKRDDGLTRDAVQTILSRSLSRRDILNLTRSRKHNIALTLAETTNDNVYYTIVALLELQERGVGVNRSPKNKFPPNIKAITGPSLYIGTSLFLAKKTPSPIMKLNPFANIDPTSGKIVPPADIQKSMDLMDMLLSGRTNEDVEKQRLIEYTTVEEEL